MPVFKQAIMGVWSVQNILIRLFLTTSVLDNFSPFLNADKENLRKEMDWWFFMFEVFTEAAETQMAIQKG